jgi:hypothetical protein
MGHKTLQMTLRYGHLAPDHKAAAVAKLDDPTETKTSTETQIAQASNVIAFPQAPTVQKVIAKTGP